MAPSPSACNAPDVSKKPMATVAPQTKMATDISAATNATTITPRIVVLIIF